MRLGPRVFVFCPINGLSQGQELDRVCLFIVVDVRTVKRIGGENGQNGGYMGLNILFQGWNGRIGYAEEFCELLGLCLANHLGRHLATAVLRGLRREMLAFVRIGSVIIASSALRRVRAFREEGGKSCKTILELGRAFEPVFVGAIVGNVKGETDRHFKDLARVLRF